MQVFLPYDNFFKTARCLDKKRLFKQVVEARQILATNGELVRKNDGGLYKPTHVNHPCVKMWKGYNQALSWYHNVLLDECKARGINTEIMNLPVCDDFVMPPWFGDKNVHDSHKSRLLQKDYSWYSKFDWDVPRDLEYVWVV